MTEKILRKWLQIPGSPPGTRHSKPSLLGEKDALWLSFFDLTFGLTKTFLPL
jgi:hypothetical protein